MALAAPLTARNDLCRCAGRPRSRSYEAAFSSACASVGFFRDHNTGTWRVEGVKRLGATDGRLQPRSLLAAELSGVEAQVRRTPTASRTLAGSILCLVSRATDWPTIFGPRDASL